ncbi:sphingosine hydroxylase [Sporobolomyces koalae]|uniref:sphingosine hydroxylase n=1 Tax=Sporobolomyces koalae TaxID=500713 RepID=UPI0031775D9E
MHNWTNPYAPLYTYPLPPAEYPWYHSERVELLPGISDKYLSVLAPVAIYWGFSLLFCFLDSLQWDMFERHRIHEPEEVTSKNRVTVREVVVAVIFQQVLQTLLGIFALEDEQPATDHVAELNMWGGRLAKLVMTAAGSKLGDDLLARYGRPVSSWIYWWGFPTLQLAWAAFILDGWQYMMHRSAHQVTYLYRTIHSWHHRLYVPYAFGALYNHPIEGFVLDTCGTFMAHMIAGLTLRQDILFFGISTAKTVDDHCGFAFPWDPFQHLFGNNADYHDIHHQVAGLKKNYSQPWFISWDIFFGTRMTREEFQIKLARRNRRGETIPSEVNGPNELAYTPTSQMDGKALKEKVN